MIFLIVLECSGIKADVTTRYPIFDCFLMVQSCRAAEEADAKVLKISAPANKSGA